MKIGLLGFGTVGGGVYALTEHRADLSVKSILLRKARNVPEGVTDIEDILCDPEISIVAEAMGGLRPAYEYVKAAMERGKHVVTANKALIACHYEELTALAKRQGVALRCTAAVGGGIPFLSSLGRIIRCDRVTDVGGIMNGTTNYILDQMAKNDEDFSTALGQAQRLGYAEADPTADIDGLDIRRKLAIAADVAFGTCIREEEILTAGIRNIKKSDVETFRANGLTCRLIAGASCDGSAMTAVVEPKLLPAGAPESAVPDCCNRITVVGEKLGVQSFFGQGAGRYPTAMNMVQDCLDIADGARGFYTETVRPMPVQNEALYRSYYVKTAHPEALRDVTAGRLGDGLVTTKISAVRMHEMREDGLFFAAMPD